MSKIKIAHEAPIDIFEEVQRKTDYDYCLVHLLEENPRYRDAFEDAVLRSAAVVVELCVHCPHGSMFPPSSPREFNSRPAGKFLSLFLN